MNTVNREEHRRETSLFTQEIAEKFFDALGLAQVMLEDYISGKNEPDINAWFALQRLFAAHVSMLENIGEMFEATQGGEPSLITQAAKIMQDEKTLKESAE